jgi:hypothetical protein
LITFCFSLLMLRILELVKLPWVYGSLLQGLGSVVELCGAIPCCPFPNPFRNVQQGLNWYPLVARLEDW